MTAIAERGHARPVATPEVTMAAALNQALADALSEDETVLVFGEDVGPLGGVFRITDGLAARFGDTRVFDTPLAESGIVGTAIGMAMNGLRPVVEMQFDAFAYPAFEQITSHLAKLRNRTMGRVALPLQMDVTSLDQITGAVDRAVDRFGRLDILVNNAGLGPENRAEGLA